MNSFRFTGQQADERILFYGRHHKITLFRNVVLSIALNMIVWTVFVFILSSLEVTPWLAAIPAFILIPLQVFWMRKKHLNTIFIITDRRVVVNLQHSPFKLQVRSIKLSQIREVEFEVHGALGSIFKYGTLIIRSDLETEVTDYKKMVFTNITHVMDLKFYLDKLAHMLAEGSTTASLPPFVTKKKGQRY